jgi:MFS transporter, PPP family, 3-phenylpropionic acid transporter
MPLAARLRLFYFLYYGAVGANLPYFAAYLRGLGFSGEQIGTVQMIGPVLAVPVALGWGTLADRLGAPGRALAVACAGSAAFALFLPLARTPLALAAVVLGQSLGERAVVPLADAATLEWARRSGGPAYTRIRLFGSLGFVVVAQALGLLLAARGDRPADAAVPLVIVTCVAGYAFAAQRLPLPAPATAARPHPREALALLRDPRLVTLLLACGLHWAACAPFHLLFGVLVRDLALPASVTGLAMATGVGAEVLALLAYPGLARRFGTRALFAVAFGGTALRWALVAMARGAPALIGLQALHALTFGLFWGASMQALTALVPPRLRATGQALYSAVVFGVGNAVGYLLAGAGYDRLGGVGPLFAWAAAVEVIPLLVTLGLNTMRHEPG